jgi:hypothetical protein
MARKTNIFAQPAEQEEAEVAVPVPTPESGLVQARIKGTWKFRYGQQVYNFVDGKTFNIPKDVFQYLKKYGNIYDTL